ncbi:MAG TPA: glycosyltransferase [Solirubrobacterales bacterium]|jgi:glycosyltransferase involved in cell wall biosynthesis|nr:glycosyltransferase [Solirubrobacterales bacterium]
MAVKGGAARRVAVYGEVDPNLVDGSSVWLQSICQVLASLDDLAVTLLLRRPLQVERRFLMEELERDPRIELRDAGRPGLLAPGEALDLLQELDREHGPFEVVLLRGQAVLAEAAARGAFDGRLWSYTMPGRGMPDETLRELVRCSARVLCQTEAAAEELWAIAPEANGSLLTLPPMIPDSGAPPVPGQAAGPLRLAYSGKLAPEYCWLETVEAFGRLRDARPDTELHVLGDKVHRPPHLPGFHADAMRTLRETAGLHWHGALPRSSIPALLAGCDVALSVRDPAVEAARELSTKVLEYGAAGLPVVLNRAPAYERLLGPDYPLFVAAPEETAAVLTGPALDPEVRSAAAAACHAASREFTFERVAAGLAQHLPSSSAPRVGEGEAQASTNGSPARPLRSARILLAGHDLKFTDPIRQAIAATGATVSEDLWQSHTQHDEAASRAALAEADTILCEWCLGNAAWYSRNVRPGQRLIVRVHRMEVYTDHPSAVDIGNVDQVVFVSQHIADEAIERFGWDPAKLVVIPNSVNVERFRLPKSEDARHTLAMVGYVPMRKRLDRALDIVEALRHRDRRFRLLSVGHPPSEFEWIVRRSEEIEYFRQCYARIQASDELRGGVEFLPFDEDLPSVFQQAGFVLSTSDSEGHQVALAEGVASGAIPVILDRPGARDQYPARWIHATVGQAAAAMAELAAAGWAGEQKIAADHVTSWSPQRVLPQWHRVLGVTPHHGAPASDRTIRV